ncbi:hypothetical protein FF38_09865 [Lucilia cuprina]|uniref:Uncharacterized protein n=1 Tax=Lucilia cuprina TaxID=7375 RepID=A0A0L0CMD0_LUCCU|nr:hypothetical protein FF38_09865 [Lucilia cuprina]
MVDVAELPDTPEDEEDEVLDEEEETDEASELKRALVILPLVFSTGSTVTTSSVSKCELTLPLTLYADDAVEMISPYYCYCYDFVAAAADDVYCFHCPDSIDDNDDVDDAVVSVVDKYEADVEDVVLLLLLLLLEVEEKVVLEEEEFELLATPVRVADDAIEAVPFVVVVFSKKKG